MSVLFVLGVSFCWSKKKSSVGSWVAFKIPWVSL